MSEYELVDLFNSHLETLLAIFMAFVSTTSAFLVATYLAAREFSSGLGKVVVALYSITSIVLMGIAQRQSVVCVDIRGEMEQSVTWHTAVYEPSWIMPTGFFSVSVVMAALFLSALWYFFHTTTRIPGQAPSRARG